MHREARFGTTRYDNINGLVDLESSANGVTHIQACCPTIQGHASVRLDLHVGSDYNRRLMAFETCTDPDKDLGTILFLKLQANPFPSYQLIPTRPSKIDNSLTYYSQFTQRKNRSRRSEQLVRHIYQ